VIGTADHVLPPAEQLFMSQRNNAHITTEIGAGHLSMITNPMAIEHVIENAARAAS